MRYSSKEGEERVNCFKIFLFMFCDLNLQIYLTFIPMEIYVDFLGSTSLMWF